MTRQQAFKEASMRAEVQPGLMVIVYPDYTMKGREDWHVTETLPAPTPRLYFQLRAIK